MNLRKLHTQIRGCIVGAYVGNVLGRLVDQKYREDISLSLPRPTVTLGTDLARLPGSLPGFPATDCWRLARGVAMSLARCHGFDPCDQALGHVAIWDGDMKGIWDQALRGGILELKEYFESYGKRGRRPTVKSSNPDVANRAGNGAIVKAVPLACAAFALGSEERLVEETKALARLTHLHRASVHGAALYALVLRRLLDQLSERDVAEPAVARDVIGMINREWMDMLDIRTIFPIANGLDADFRLVLPPEAVESSTATEASCSASGTLAFVLGTFIRYPKDFGKGMLEMLNAGGNTSERGLILGALLGANVGIEGIPSVWLNLSAKCDHALRVADDLMAAFYGEVS